MKAHAPNGWCLPNGDEIIDLDQGDGPARLGDLVEKVTRLSGMLGRSVG